MLSVAEHKYENGLIKEINGKVSVYYEGYWIRYYAPPEDTLEEKKILIESLTRRTFHHTEPGINTPGEKLELAREAYDREWNVRTRPYDGIRELLSDPETTTARLVMNPEKMVIAEARRTYTYLGLFGYGVDSAIVNRVLPEEVNDPYFQKWRDIQEGHLAAVDEGFAGLDIRHLRLFDQEMVGPDNLRIVGTELYGDMDPTERLSISDPIRVEDVEGTDDVALVLTIPLVDREHVEVMRKDDEIYVTVDNYRRSLALPDSLKRRTVRRAKLSGGELRIEFTLEK